IKPLRNLFSEFRSLYGSKIKNLDNIHEVLDSESEIYITLNLLKDLKSNFSVSIKEKNIPLSKIEYILDSFDLYSTELSKLSSLKNDYPRLYQEWKFDNLNGELNNLELNRAKKTMGLLNVILELDDILRAKFSEISNE
ncbi:hypothetical protein, partial [Acinetobacter seifertii]|uniref:hypothetical protein n=1 Tax=Acinetobacter seifertii TaxID=1530123 RepID=UPI00157FE196